MSEINLPYLQIKNVNELLEKIPPKIISSETFSSNDLANNIGISRSVSNNLIVTLKSLNLITGRGKLKLTENGDKYIKYIKREDIKEAKGVLDSEVDKLEFFQLIENMLNNKEKLTNVEIGNYLAINYDKNWEKTATVRAHGSAIGSIFDYLERGHYYNGVLSLSKLKQESLVVSTPTVETKKILKILKSLYVAGADVDSLSKKIGTTKNRLFSELSCCESLGLVDRMIKGTYTITNKGADLINPNLSEEEIAGKFKDIIFDSPYNKIIHELPNDNLNADIVGEILAYQLKKDWAPDTAKSYGKKFINWLKFSKIIEKTDPGKYKILKSNNITKLIKTPEPEEKFSYEVESNKITDNDLLKYYLLGKNIGIITEKTSKVEDDDTLITQIVSLCRGDVKLKDTIKYWKDDYVLFNDLKDLRIFIRDIERIEELLGVSNW